MYLDTSISTNGFTLAFSHLRYALGKNTEPKSVDSAKCQESLTSGRLRSCGT